MVEFQTKMIISKIISKLKAIPIEGDDRPVSP